jgi:hypothetical protein
MTAHGDEVRRHGGAGPFFSSDAPSARRPGDADPGTEANLPTRYPHPPQTARRQKTGCALPGEPIRYCLEEDALSLDELNYIAFYEKPFPKFERLIETYLAFAPRGFASFRMALPLWLKEKLFRLQCQRRADRLHPAEDAFRCFMGTDIDLLVAGNCVARKEDQDASLRVDYRGMFESD